MEIFSTIIEQGEARFIYTVQRRRFSQFCLCVYVQGFKYLEKYNENQLLIAHFIYTVDASMPYIKTEASFFVEKKNSYDQEIFAKVITNYNIIEHV